EPSMEPENNSEPEVSETSSGSSWTNGTPKNKSSVPKKGAGVEAKNGAQIECQGLHVTVRAKVKASGLSAKGPGSKVFACDTDFTIG
ncbi:13225_t:CDS:2, partial [Acaulospora colombiana]